MAKNNHSRGKYLMIIFVIGIAIAAGAYYYYHYYLPRQDVNYTSGEMLP